MDDKKWAWTVNLLIVIIILIGGYFRFKTYGDFGLSVSNPETNSYIDSSQAPLLSWEIFANNRLFTTNLLYKLANDPKRCPPPPYSAPAIGQEKIREIHNCFDSITKIQNWAALLGWGGLALTVSRWLTSKLFKVIAVIVILLFAFTPQIAEWDSVLSPESLSLSLIALSLALLVELCISIARGKDHIDGGWFLAKLTAWVVIYTIWIFIRDIHLYTIIPTLLLLGGLFLSKSFMRSLPLRLTAIFLIAVLILGYLSAREGQRATNGPLNHAFDAYIWPYPARVAFISEYNNMPDKGSAEFAIWFNENATEAYAYFLLSHPGFIISTLWNSMGEFTTDFVQPYFDASEVPGRAAWLQVGQMLHPETSAVFLIDLLLLTTFGLQAIRTRQPEWVAWCGLALWLLAIAIATLLPGFFGDIGGTHRHIFPSVELLRLFLWIFLIKLMDAWTSLPAMESDTG